VNSGKAEGQAAEMMGEAKGKANELVSCRRLLYGAMDAVADMHKQAGKAKGTAEEVKGKMS
jgi:uncharacterized protein YjbJ (UPF0337 family)